jgi:hypothetical protein
MDLREGVEPSQGTERRSFGTLVSNGVQPHPYSRPVTWSGTLTITRGVFISVSACERHSSRLVERHRLPQTLTIG